MEGAVLQELTPLVLKPAWLDPTGKEPEVFSLQSPAGLSTNQNPEAGELVHVMRPSDQPQGHRGGWGAWGVELEGPKEDTQQW